MLAMVQYCAAHSIVRDCNAINAINDGELDCSKWSRNKSGVDVLNMVKNLCISILLLTFAIGIVGFGHPMIRAKLAPPFPIFT
jgi:hypothetical protein